METKRRSTPNRPNATLLPVTIAMYHHGNWSPVVYCRSVEMVPIHDTPLNVTIYIHLVSVLAFG